MTPVDKTWSQGRRSAEPTLPSRSSLSNKAHSTSVDLCLVQDLALQHYYTQLSGILKNCHTVQEQITPSCLIKTTGDQRGSPSEASIYTTPQPKRRQRDL